MRAHDNTAAQQYLVELEARVRSGGDLRESSSTPVFDAGREGLDFFRSFGPVYARYRGENFDFGRDIADKYDAQREIGFAHLRADADRLRELHGAMSETTVDFRNSAGPLFGAWRGKAADKAQGNLDDLVSAAGSTGSRIGELADTIDTVVTAAERIAVGKARFVRDLAADDVGGLSTSDVELLVTAAGERENPSDEALAGLAKLCHVQAEPKVCRADKDVLRMVANDVSGWLDNVFVPFYEARREAFDAVCADAAANLASAWDLLRKALNHMASEHDTAVQPQREPTTSAAKTTPTPAPAPESAGNAAVAGPEQQDNGAFGGSGAVADMGDRLEPGAGTGSGETEMMGMSGTVPPAGPAPSSAAPTGQSGYSGYYYPASGFGSGGGDRDRRRSLPLIGDAVFGDDSATPGSHVIGGGEDETLYNEDDLAALIESEAPKPESKAEIDEEDLW